SSCDPSAGPRPRSASTSSAAPRNSRCATRWCSPWSTPTATRSCRSRRWKCPATTSRCRPTPPAPTPSASCWRARCSARWPPRSCAASMRPRASCAPPRNECGGRMQLKPDRLAATLAAEPLRPVYLVAGPEPLLVLEAADAIRASARAAGFGEREVFDADGRDFDWNTLDASFRAPSLFSAQRLLELRLATGRPGKEGAEVIAGYCAQPPGDIVLLVTGGKWSEAITKAGHFVNAPVVRPHELEGWLESRLRQRGVRADRGAVQRLAERVQGNLLAAAQEVDKLALLADGAPLDAARMEAL